MFPTDPVVLLVNADHVLTDARLTIALDKHGIKIFDDAQTIATKCEVIGRTASSSITKVEGLLAMKWRPRVTIRYSHFRKTETV